MDSLVGDVLDALEDIGHGTEFEENDLVTSAEEGLSSPKFTSIVSKLVSQLRLFYSIDEVVHPTKGPEDAENFLFEISGFLSEYGCPYESLVSGELNKRLQNKEQCLTLLLFLTSELQAAKMFFTKNPNQIISKAQSDPESEALFEQLKRLCIALNMSKPPDNIALERFLTGIQNKLTEVMKTAPSHCLSQPVIKCQLGPVHWEKLEAINAALINEYTTRRSMLLKRVDVTISSFNWSDRAKANMNTIAQAYQARRHSMKAKPAISLAHLLAARDDLSQIYKTSSGSTRHACAINKVVMGSVPDRGGRANEVAPPPPEMPSWQKRQDGGGRGGGGFRGGGGGRGGQNYSRDGGRGGYGGGGDRGGYGGGRGGSRPHSGRGGGSRWGRGGHQDGAFEQTFSQGGQRYGAGGFGYGRQTYSS